METTPNGRPSPNAAQSVQRALLLALLDPPEYGGSLSALARELGEPEAAITAAARLEERGLAHVGNGHVVASGAVLDLDALRPFAI